MRLAIVSGQVDAERQTVAYLRQGLEINLGSIGKGHALDRAASLIDAPNLLMHGGHSSILARGNEAPPAPGWTVGLCDPVQPHCRRALVYLRNRALATSANETDISCPCLPIASTLVMSGSIRSSTR